MWVEAIALVSKTGDSPDTPPHLFAHQEADENAHMKMSRETSLLASLTHTTASGVSQGRRAESLEHMREGLELEERDAHAATGRVAGVMSEGGGFAISSASLSLNERHYLMDLDVPVDVRPTLVGSASTPAVVTLTAKERHETDTLEGCKGANDVRHSGVATDARHSSVASDARHSGIASHARRVPCAGAAEITLPKTDAARSQARMKQVPCPPSRRPSCACARVCVCVRVCVCM